MTCPQCGAAIKRGDGRFCSHCAAALPDRPRIAPEEWSTHRERFEEAEGDAQHAAALSAPAPEPSWGSTVILPGVFLVVWILFGGFLVSRAATGPGGMVLFPLLIVGGGAIGISLMISKALRKAKSPVERALAVVVGDRTEITTHGSSDDRRTSTSYYATLQFKDGARVELPTSGGIVGHTTRGDIGLAVMRGGDLVDFHRYQL
ncbi:MAG TPA: DUF2500 family protein [Kofleriaceae bacterium]|nr:DUF2500 family protein [Kofleriaceae bacterium]